MIAHYFTIALRHLARHRISTAVSVVGLALGLACFIGAYMFAAFLGSAESGFAKSERIHVMYQSTEVPAMGLSLPFMSDATHLLAEHLRTEFPEIEAVARARSSDSTLVTVNGQRSFRSVTIAEPEFLDIFDMPFEAGSAAASVEVSDAAILTEASALALFGRADVVGERIDVGEIGLIEVTGVLGPIAEPSQFARSLAYGEGATEVFVITHSPGRFEPPELAGWNDDYEWLFGNVTNYILLPEDGSLRPATINARMDDFIARHATIEEGRIGFKLRHVSTVVQEDLDSMLWDAFDVAVSDIFLVLGAIVLLTACVNFVNLATARGTLRAKEAGLRKTLGARRGQLMLQHVFEGVIVAVVAAAGALIALQFATSSLNERFDLQVALPWSAGAAFWLFVLVTTLAVGVASSAYPAFGLASVRPVAALQSGAGRGGPQWLRTALIGIQFMAASIMLIIVFVVAAQNAQLRQAADDIRSSTLVVIETSLQQAGIDSEMLRTRLMQSPHVEAVTGASVPPWEPVVGGTGYTLTPENDGSYRFTQNQAVSYGFFEVHGIEVLAGRSFSREFGDDFELGDATRPIVVDRLAAAQFGWSPEEAIGKAIYGTSVAGNPFPLTIVGVVEHKPSRIFGWTARAFVYSLDQEGITLPIIRVSDGNLAPALEAIDAVWEDLAPDSPIVRSMADERFARSYALFDVASRGITVLAGFAFVIACMGLFGMAYFLAARRRHEMGVRKVLGSSSKRLFALLLSDFLRPVLIANLVAWPVGYFVALRYVGIFIEPVPVTLTPFIASLLITLVIAAVVVLHQAVRAAALPPAEVLRYE